MICLGIVYSLFEFYSDWLAANYFLLNGTRRRINESARSLRRLWVLRRRLRSGGPAGLRVRVVMTFHLTHRTPVPMNVCVSAGIQRRLRRGPQCPVSDIRPWFLGHEWNRISWYRPQTIQDPLRFPQMHSASGRFSILYANAINNLLRGYLDVSKSRYE